MLGSGRFSPARPVRENGAWSHRPAPQCPKSRTCNIGYQVGTPHQQLGGELRACSPSMWPPSASPAFAPARCQFFAPPTHVLRVASLTFARPDCGCALSPSRIDAARSDQPCRPVSLRLGESGTGWGRGYVDVLPMGRTIHAGTTAFSSIQHSSRSR